MSADDQERHVALARNRHRDGTEQRGGDGTVAVGAHDDHVVVLFLGVFGDDVAHVTVERLGRDVHAGARENGLDLVGDRARFGKAVGLFVLSALLNVDQREGRALFEEVDMLCEEALDAK